MYIKMAALTVIITNTHTPIHTHISAFWYKRKTRCWGVITCLTTCVLHLACPEFPDSRNNQAFFRLYRPLC